MKQRIEFFEKPSARSGMYTHLESLINLYRAFCNVSDLQKSVRVSLTMSAMGFVV